MLNRPEGGSSQDQGPRGEPRKTLWVRLTRTERGSWSRSSTRTGRASASPSMNGRGSGRTLSGQDENLDLSSPSPKTASPSTSPRVDLTPEQIAQIPWISLDSEGLEDLAERYLAQLNTTLWSSWEIHHDERRRAAAAWLSDTIKKLHAFRLQEEFRQWQEEEMNL
jgi:hypothetical protein